MVLLSFFCFFPYLCQLTSVAVTPYRIRSGPSYLTGFHIVMGSRQLYYRA